MHSTELPPKWTTAHEPLTVRDARGGAGAVRDPARPRAAHQGGEPHRAARARAARAPRPGRLARRHPPRAPGPRPPAPSAWSHFARPRPVRLQPLPNRALPRPCACARGRARALLRGAQRGAAGRLLRGVRRRGRTYLRCGVQALGLAGPRAPQHHGVALRGVAAPRSLEAHRSTAEESARALGRRAPVARVGNMGFTSRPPEYLRRTTRIPLNRNLPALHQASDPRQPPFTHRSDSTEW